jgi:hypothetical protein
MSPLYFHNIANPIRSVPLNCRFEIDDAEEEWIYSQSFDYIHGRALVSCFKDPVAAKIFANLNPYGYFEFQVPIMSLKPSTEH